MLTACSPSVDKYNALFLGTFDTAVQIIGYSDSRAAFDSVADDAKALMTELHELFDIYNDYGGINNIKTINDMAGIAPVVVDERVIDLIEFCLDMYDATGGAVNIALGPVLRLWHDYREAGVAIPSESELEAAYTLCVIGDVVINREASTVFLRKEGMSLDVGACAKGFASGLVADSLPDGYLLSAGGNVVVSGIPADDRDAWSVGIQDPEFKNEKSILKLAVSGGAIVTSGDYQRTYTVDGISYCHIIDPQTLMPSRNYRSVSVIGEDSATCDALSTAIFIMSKEEGAKLAADYGCEVIWIMPGMAIEMTEGAKALVAE